MWKLLILIALGFGLMLGVVSKKRTLKTIGMMFVTHAILIMVLPTFLWIPLF